MKNMTHAMRTELANAIRVRIPVKVISHSGRS